MGAGTGKSETDGWDEVCGEWEMIPETRWGISKGTIIYTYRNEDDVGGRARVTRDEERVLRCEYGFRT